MVEVTTFTQEVLSRVRHDYYSSASKVHYKGIVLEGSRHLSQILEAMQIVFSDVEIINWSDPLAREKVGNDRDWYRVDLDYLYHQFVE